MSWTTTFADDTDKPGVGTARATWSADGESLTHEARIDERSDLPGFVDTAKAKLAAYQAKRAAANSIAAKIAAALNA